MISLNFFKIKEIVIHSELNKNKVPVILTEDEIINILNRFSIGMLSDNLDDDDKNLARKLSHALKQVKAGEND